MTSSLSYFCIMLCSSLLFMANKVFLTLFSVVSIFSGPNNASLSSKFKADIYKHICFLTHRSSCVAVVYFLQNTFVESLVFGSTMMRVLIVVHIIEMLSSLLSLAIPGRIQWLHSYPQCSKIPDKS